MDSDNDPCATYEVRILACRYKDVVEYTPFIVYAMDIHNCKRFGTNECSLRWVESGRERETVYPMSRSEHNVPSGYELDEVEQWAWCTSSCATHCRSECPVKPRVNLVRIRASVNKKVTPPPATPVKRTFPPGPSQCPPAPKKAFKPIGKVIDLVQGDGAPVGKKAKADEVEDGEADGTGFD